MNVEFVFGTDRNIIDKILIDGTFFVPETKISYVDLMKDFISTARIEDLLDLFGYISKTMIKRCH